MSSPMEMISDWQEEPFKKGAVYYMQDGRVHGVLLWNVWEKVHNARALMNEARPFKEKVLKGRIAG